MNDGLETAIYSMGIIFENSSTQAVILVDTNNAFNSINWKVALNNTQVTCPYHSPSRLVVLGGAEIQSTEGTTQFDNLAMYFYALETIKIQNHLRTASKVKQVWLVDDTTGAGSLKSLKK